MVAEKRLVIFDKLNKDKPLHNEISVGGHSQLVGLNNSRRGAKLQARRFAIGDADRDLVRVHQEMSAGFCFLAVIGAATIISCGSIIKGLLATVTATATGTAYFSQWRARDSIRSRKPVSSLDWQIVGTHV